MPLIGDALKVRAFNFDPWSVSGDHFAAAYVMTDDGLYRTTGLPTTSNWTQKLSKAAAASLIGQAEANTHLIWSFTPSVRLAGFVMCGAGYEYTEAGEQCIILYMLVSNDYGANWTCDTSKYLRLKHNDWNKISLSASYHLDSVYYVNYYGGGWIMGNEGYNPAWWDQGPHAQIIAKSTALPAFDLDDGANFTGAGGAADPYIWVPLYCDNTGTPYANDATGLLLGQVAGTYPIAKSTALFTTTPPTATAKTDISTGGMPNSLLATANMFNDNVIIAWSGSTIWLTQNGGSTWTSKTVQLGGVNVTVTSVFSIPSNPDTFVLVGALASGGICGVALTTDFGATFLDRSLTGDPSGIDAVLGLGAGDANGAMIEVDYYKV